MGLKIATDKQLDAKHLSEELSRVRRNLVVHYGRYDSLPDTDIIIYDSTNYEVLAIISSKVTLRERIAQTAYWKLKLSSDPVTKDIKALFVTTDEDGDLIKRVPIELAKSKSFSGR